MNFCEFDKYAAKSYCAIHGTSETLNLGDITKVDEREIELKKKSRFSKSIQKWNIKR